MRGDETSPALRAKKLREAITTSTAVRSTTTPTARTGDGDGGGGEVAAPAGPPTPRSALLDMMGEECIQNVALGLQVMAGLATAGTYYRFMVDLNLPLIFLCLPCGLVLLPFVTRLTGALNDLTTRETVTGVLTGVTCSFLVVAGVTHKWQLVVMRRSSGGGDGDGEPPSLPLGPALLRLVELLHLPVLVAIILFTFVVSVRRLPTATGLATALATALSVDFFLVTCLVMLRRDDVRGSDVVADMLLLFVPSLLTCLMPLFHDRPRSWILNLMLIFVLALWEVVFFGSALWIPSSVSFPVPACLVGVVFAFHSAHLDPEKLRRMERQLLATLPQVMEKDHQVYLAPTAGRPPPPPASLFGASLLWHCVAFCVERVALIRIFNEQVYKSDWVMYTLTLGLFMFSMSSYMDGGRTLRVLTTSLLLLVYLSFCLSGHTFQNPFGLQMVIGMCMVCITDPV